MIRWLDHITKVFNISYNCSSTASDLHMEIEEANIRLAPAWFLRMLGLVSQDRNIHQIISWNHFLMQTGSFDLTVHQWKLYNLSFTIPLITPHPSFNIIEGFIIHILSRQPGKWCDATSMIFYNGPRGKSEIPTSLVSIRICQFSTLPG